MLKRHILTLGAILLLASLMLAACGGPRTAELTVDMHDFAFEPAQLSVPANAQVTLNLSNSGTLEHELVIVNLGERLSAPVDEEALGELVFWEEELQPGESETLEFQAPSEPGTYQVICGIAGHLEQGMEGTLSVTQ
ncbi:MAG TPA: cupredoxin domain-containing protein [Anaerolineales bacterium]|jgi:uncharacterized cupredoxin-like copper-binding protein